MEVLHFTSMQGGKIFWSVLMTSVMRLMQEEDILEHTNGKCCLCTF